MTNKLEWDIFCARAEAMMRDALENKIPLRGVSDFFENDNTIKNPDLRRYIESMIWEIDASREYYMDVLHMFEARALESDFIRYLKS